MFGGMEYLSKLKWSAVKQTLSGNREIESAMESMPLPPGHHWLVIVNRQGYWFAGSRKAKLRDSGKGQLAYGGQSGVSCELIRGRTSTGRPVEFLEIVERPGKPFAVGYLAPADPVPVFE